jgi:hypothetical protein
MMLDAMRRQDPLPQRHLKAHPPESMILFQGGGCSHQQELSSFLEGAWGCSRPRRLDDGWMATRSRCLVAGDLWWRHHLGLDLLPSLVPILDPVCLHQQECMSPFLEEGCSRPRRLDDGWMATRSRCLVAGGLWRRHHLDSYLGLDLLPSLVPILDPVPDDDDVMGHVRDNRRSGDTLSCPVRAPRRSEGTLVLDLQTSPDAGMRHHE